GKDVSLPHLPEVAVSPNPFNSSCAIAVPAESEVVIYDLMGNEVFGVSDAPSDGSSEKALSGLSDSKKFFWKPDRSVSSGTYILCAVLDDGRKISKKIVYLK
ncbi:hypothetical protein DRQ26_03220, partial [bacterium]